LGVLKKSHRKFQNVSNDKYMEKQPMTENKDITYFEQKLLEFQGEEDPLCAMLGWVTEQMMEIEVSHRTGAVKGKHVEDRRTSRSGYRTRRWDTRLGTVFLSIPKVRDGGYIPFFLTERKRSEQALVEVVREAWVNGVSTRKMDRLAKSLGIESISASQVSNLTQGLDEMVASFRSRPLEEEYPVLWVDALYEKVREFDRVVSTAVLIVKPPPCKELCISWQWSRWRRKASRHICGCSRA
jgi:transposase-like protein